MSLDTRRDPVLGYNFQIALTDSAAGTGKLVTSIALAPLIANPLAGFSECSGLELTLETEDFNEGGNNGTVLKFPKRMKYGEITLRKGLTRRTDLFDWCYGFSQGIAQRKDGVITLQDASHKPYMAWACRPSTAARASTRSNRRSRSRASRSCTKGSFNWPAHRGSRRPSARLLPRSGVSSDVRARRPLHRSTAMNTQVLISQVVNRVRAVDGNAAIAPETVRALAEVILPLVRDMFDHDERVRNEGSLRNGYVDRIERGSL
jgi:phage tail-like protein